MKKRFRYDTIFTYGSLQSVGHIMEYFIASTRKLVIFIIMPRVNGTNNVLRIYHEGKLTFERPVRSSRHIIWYYVLWWLYHNYFVLKHFDSNERILVLTGHPIALMGMSLLTKLRRITYAYWIGDYYPPTHWTLILFEKLKKFYHERMRFTYYLSDAINQKFNGVVKNSRTQKTVVWGVAPPVFRRRRIPKSLKLLFVGVVRPSQGLEDVFYFLSKHKTYSLSVIGVCEASYYKKLERLAEKLSIQKQLFFPNEFYPNEKLFEVAKSHHVGVALYTDSPLSSSYYTDPGKVKTYIELGLPVIMTDTSAIAPYIRRFHCGEVIRDNGRDLIKALRTIKSRYAYYQKSLTNFLRHFSYEQYYRESFRAFEKL